MSKIIKIGKKKIGRERSVFIIAEAGVNHENNIDTAKKMIEEAAAAGADAIKFQVYKAEKIALKNSPAYWSTNKTQYNYFEKYDRFGEAEYRKLASYSKRTDIIFMATPFDEEAVDFLNELMPAFKISSADITNTPLIKHIARKGKPVFLSTGASTIGEIEEAIRTIEGEGNNQIVINHCILSYPTKYKNANLNMIKHLNAVFPEYIIGYSDHTLPDSNMAVLTTAYLLGARVIEKHFTLDKTLPGNDHYHAIDPQDLKTLIQNLKLLKKILGQDRKDLIESELSSRLYARRSIVAKVDILKGTVITKDMLTQKRPGTGISPAMTDIVVGRETKKDIKADSLVLWEHI